MQIDEFEHSLGKAPKRRVIEDKVITIKRPKRTKVKLGTICNWHAFLSALFEKNEYLPRNQKLPDEELRDRLLTGVQYNNLKKFFWQRRLTIGSLRRKYNRHQLTAESIYLISQTYDKLGYPIVGGHNCFRYSNYLYFEEAYARCVAWKIADPRFVPHEYIVELRNRQLQNDPDWLDWIVPNDKELQTIATKLKVGTIENIYNSVVFARYHNREDTPKDFVPFERLYGHKGGVVTCPPERL